MNNISRRKRIVDTDVVNDVTYTHQNVITHDFYDTTLCIEEQRHTSKVCVNAVIENVGIK